MSETFPKIVRSDNRHTPIAALHVEVIADLVCPFCYLGKRRLELALDAVQGPTEIGWFPYQLNPDMPDEGLTLDEYLSLRFGNPATIQPGLDQLTAEGRDSLLTARAAGDHRDAFSLDSKTISALMCEA